MYTLDKTNKQDEAHLEQPLTHSTGQNIKFKDKSICSA
jgi:hypothetical protein